MVSPSLHSLAQQKNIISNSEIEYFIYVDLHNLSTIYPGHFSRNCWRRQRTQTIIYASNTKINNSLLLEQLFRLLQNPSLWKWYLWKNNCTVSEELIYWSSKWLDLISKPDQLDSFEKSFRFSFTSAIEINK